MPKSIRSEIGEKCEKCNGEGSCEPVIIPVPCDTIVVHMCMDCRLKLSGESPFSEINKPGKNKGEKNA